MASTERIKYEKVEGEIFVKCAHCGGSGSTSKMCCNLKVGKNDNYIVVCCACDGKGVQRA